MNLKKEELIEICIKKGIKGYSNKNKNQLITLLKESECDKNMSLKDINERIEKEICYDTIEKLLDINMMDEYNNCISVQNKIVKLENILSKYIPDNTKKLIINDYLNELIPAGTKGVCRGNKFNKIIKEKILSMNIDKKRFVIEFEKKCPNFDTTERPDWYIYDNVSKKVIIGMNQLDLWNGGHQINRGNKYIVDIKENNICKILCVVCNKVIVKNSKTSLFRIFEKGFQNNTLCYLNNLSNIIQEYFKLND